MHRPLTGRCILPMMGTCTASRIRCGGTSHDAATRHTRATTRRPQLCMAARMREGTQAHTAASMSACPRAPGQARYVLLHVPAHVVPGPVCRWALRRAGPRARARARARGRCSMTAPCRLAPASAGVFCSPSFSSLQPRPRPRRSSCLDQPVLQKQPAFSLKKKNPPFKGGQRGRKGSGRRIRAGSDVGRGWDVGRTWAGRARDITRGRSRACCRPSLSLPSGCPSRSKCNSVLPRGEPRQQTPRRFRRLARLRASHRAMSKDEEYDYLFKGGPGRTAPALACEGRHIRSCCRQRRTGWANLDPSRTGLLLHCANAVAALLLCFYRLLTLAGALWRSGAHRGLGRRKVESAFALHPE